MAPDAEVEAPPPVFFRAFLMNQPPPATRTVKGVASKVDVGVNPDTWDLTAPRTVVIYCEDEKCEREMLFETDGTHLGQVRARDATRDTFLKYRCRHCERSEKVYAVRLRLSDEKTGMIEATKYGEWPFFGAPLPTRLFKLVGVDRELFLKGRRAENANLGIGAFSYYRRVVENQKNRFINEMIAVARRTGAKQEVIDQLEAAKAENQFGRAVDDVRGAIPGDLMIKGHNPLTLLFRPLSAGLHGRTDEECLELAASIRVVLTELAERMDGVLKDQAELDKAVARLLDEIKSEAEGASGVPGAESQP